MISLTKVLSWLMRAYQRDFVLPYSYFSEWRVPIPERVIVPLLVAVSEPARFDEEIVPFKGVLNWLDLSIK
jgi:hypothetical protein